MRKQYYFRESERGTLAWDVDRLVALSRRLAPRHMPIGDLRELDEAWAGPGERPSWRAMVEHMRLIADADLSYPIILAANGQIMDGRHRLAKAALEGRSTILAVQFAVDPEPDYVGKGPDDLPY